MLLLQQIVDAVGVVATFLSGAEDTVPIRTITRISGFVGFVMKLQLDDLIVCLSEGDLNAKLNLLDELKYTVKHHTVPEDAFPNLFRAISIGISDGSSADATLPIIPVLVRRLCNQNQQDVIEAHAAELAGVLVDRLGDGNDSTRKQAVASLIDLWPYFPDLEKLVKEQVLSSHNNHTKVCGMRLAVLMHRKNSSLPLRTFVNHLLLSTEAKNQTVRETAKATIVEIFQHAPPKAKESLARDLSRKPAHSKVRDAILAELARFNAELEVTPYLIPETGSSTGNEMKLVGSDTKQASRHVSTSTMTTNLTSSSSTKPSTNRTAVTVPSASFAASDTTYPTPNPTTYSKLDPHKPLDVNDTGSFELSKDLALDAVKKSVKLEDLCNIMLPDFEDKETEKNWSRRERNILILRQLTHGNAVKNFHQAFLTQVKGLNHAILKNVNSLRTTVSSAACLLIQELAPAFGPGLDSIVEIQLQALSKLAGHTKKISAQNANSTVTAIFQNVTFHVRLLSHVLNAAQDKNMQPRRFAPLWMKTIIQKHSGNKAILEHSNGLSVIEQILQKGLADADSAVRENARDLFWTFNSVWPTRGENVMASLKPASQLQLVQHAGNPHSNPHFDIIAGTGSGPTMTRPQISKSATAPGRPTLKDAMKAKKAEKIQAERSKDAHEASVTERPLLSRPATTVVKGTLASAPIRPKAKPRQPTVRPQPIEVKPLGNHEQQHSPTASLDSKAKDLVEAQQLIASIESLTEELSDDEALVEDVSATIQSIEDELSDSCADDHPTMEPSAADNHIEMGQPAADDHTKMRRPTADDHIRVEDHKPVKARGSNSSIRSLAAEPELSGDRADNHVQIEGPTTMENRDHLASRRAVELLDSTISRTMNGLMGAHEYRAIQSTIGTHAHNLQSDQLSRLAKAIVERLKIPHGSQAPIIQMVETLKLLFSQGRKEVDNLAPQAVDALLRAAGGREDDDHVHCIIWRYLHQLEQKASPDLIATEIFKTLDLDTPPAGWPTQAYRYLATLVREGGSNAFGGNVTPEIQLQYVQTGLKSHISECRRSAIQWGIEVHFATDDKTKLNQWIEEHMGSEQRELFTYFLTKDHRSLS